MVFYVVVGVFWGFGVSVIVYFVFIGVNNC